MISKLISLCQRTFQLGKAQTRLFENVHIILMICKKACKKCFSEICMPLHVSYVYMCCVILLETHYYFSQFKCYLNKWTIKLTTMHQRVCKTLLYLIQNQQLQVHLNIVQLIIWETFFWKAWLFIFHTSATPLHQYLARNIRQSLNRTVSSTGTP